MAHLASACWKKAYPNRSHAANDAQTLRRKSNKTIVPYWCRHCQTWHVGELFKDKK